MRQEIDEVGKILTFEDVNRIDSKLKTTEPVKPEVVLFGKRRSYTGFFSGTSEYLRKVITDLYLDAGYNPPTSRQPLRIPECYSSHGKLRMADWLFKSNSKKEIYFFSVSTTGRESPVAIIEKAMYVKKRDLLIYKKQIKVMGSERQYEKTDVGLDAVPNIQKLASKFVKR